MKKPEVGTYYRYEDTIVEVLGGFNERYSLKCLEADVNHSWEVGRVYDGFSLTNSLFVQINLSMGQIYRKVGTNDLVKVTGISENRLSFMHLSSTMSIPSLTKISYFLNDYCLFVGNRCENCELPARWLDVETRGIYCWSCYGV